MAEPVELEELEGKAVYSMDGKLEHQEILAVEEEWILLRELLLAMVDQEEALVLQEVMLAALAEMAIMEKMLLIFILQECSILWKVEFLICIIFPIRLGLVLLVGVAVAAAALAAAAVLVQM